MLHIKDKILNHLKTIKPSLQQNGMEKIGIFGSIAKGNNDVVSDIDIIIKFKKSFFDSCDPWNYFEIINNLKDDIYSKFKIKVDVFDEDSNSPYKNNIIKDSIYV
jgi:predicted nucleotidyltransferase